MCSKSTSLAALQLYIRKDSCNQSLNASYSENNITLFVCFLTLKVKIINCIISLKKTLLLETVSCRFTERLGNVTVHGILNSS